MATPALPPRDSPWWEECKSTTPDPPPSVRSQPSLNGTLIDKIYKDLPFWIDTTTTVKTSLHTWAAVKTGRVVGWCASPPMTYTLVTPEPPPDDDTQPLPPPNTDAPLVTPLLTTDEIRQTIAAYTVQRDALDIIHLEIAKFRNALDEQIRILSLAIERGQGL